MARLFSSFFLGKDAAPTSPQARARAGQRSGLMGIAANAMLFGIKFAVGTASRSVAITADAWNNLSDAASAIVTYLGFRLARRPADDDHPYGHARYEYLSALAVAVMILFIGLELLKASVQKILNPAPVALSPVMGALLVGSIGVKLVLALVNGRLGRLIQSPVLAATAADSRNDCIATGSVLLGALIAHWTDVPLDGWMGLGVSVFILVSGWGMAKDTVSTLLGQGADPELVEQIRRELRADSRILGWHDLLVHDYGPGSRFASVHAELDWRQDPLLCHEILDRVERACLKKYGIHLVIHYDPVVTDDAQFSAVKARLAQVLADIHPDITFHDLRTVAGPGHTTLIFDLIVPRQLHHHHAEVRAAIDQGLNDGAQRRYETVITFDSAAFNPPEPGK